MSAVLAIVPSAEPVDLNAAARFLTLLDESAARFSFQTFDDSPAKRPDLARIFHGTLAEHGAELSALNARGCGVFVTINETDLHGRKTANVTRVRAVFADTDGAPLDPIMRCRLEPHIVVESSPGKWHVFWLVDGLPLGEFTDVQKTIAAKFGTDRSVIDLPRVMRLPGFFHRKGKPFRVRVIHESGGQPYAAERVRAEFVPAPAPTAPPQASAGSTGPQVKLDSDGDRVEVNRHQYLLKRSLLMAAAVKVGTFTRDDAMAALFAERDGGKYTREVPDREIIEALDGALAKPGTAPNDAKPDGLLRVVVAGMIAAAEAPAFVVHPIIPRRVVTMLNAPGGTGKSTLALAIGACVASGNPFGPFAVEQGRCVVVSLEDEVGQIAFQLGNVVAAAGLDAATVDRSLVIADGAADDVSLAHETRDGALIGDAALAQLAELARGCALVIVDGVGDALRGNTNDATIVRDFIRRKLGRIARETNCAILLIGHVDKAGARHGTNGQTFLGSVEFNNSARSRLAVAERDGRLWLDHEKSNRAAKASPLALRRHPCGALLPDDAAGGTPDEGVALVAATDADALLLAIRGAVEAGANVPTARSGPATAQHVLSTLSDLPQTLRGPKGRVRFWAALDRLRRSGRVSSEVYQDEYRHQRTRWMPT